MANPLTGDFDAVVQIAVRQINGLLAALHQNGARERSDRIPRAQQAQQVRGAVETAALKLLHSVSLRVGDPRRRPPDLAGFGDWMLDFQDARAGGSASGLRTELVDLAPPGASRRLDAAFTAFDSDGVFEIPPDVVKGRARLQLSTVRLSVAEGSTSEVTVHADVRAHYDADPATTPLPAPVNGEVRAAFEVRKVATRGRTRLLIRPSQQDEKIDFIAAPGSGLSRTDADRIAGQVRKVLREGMTLLPVDLPAGFPFADFKGVGSGANAAVALPLQLSSVGPPPGAIQSITQSFIGSSGFAFAVSRQHVQGLIDIEAIRQAIRQRTITLSLRPFGFSLVEVTYRLRFSSGPTLTFRPGVIEISGRVEAETSTFWAPNGFVSFKQNVTLVLDPASGRVDLEAFGEPQVDESRFIPHSRAVDIVKSENATALAANRPAVRRVFQDAKTSLVNGLRTFERTASASYTQVEVSPDGVTIRGELASAQRIAPVVHIGEADQGRVFTAFHSWIPGGRIERLIWSWVEYPRLRPSVWSGVVRSMTETHRFIVPKPPGITEVSSICLRIEGSRVLPDGRIEQVHAGTVCEVPEPVLAISVPSWWEPVTVPVWFPGLAEDAALEDGIAAHVSVQTDRPPQALTQNSLVYFADWRAAAPLDALSKALEAMRQQSVSLAVFVIVPVGSFNGRRRELQARLAALPAQIAGRVQVAEDAEGGWARTFDVTETPSFFLINARGEFVWKSAGEPNPAEVAAALDAHIVPAPGPRFRPLRLKVSAGDRAPDVFFRDEGGDEWMLHRLRGRPVSFLFWQSWSAPCLKELRRLQALQDAEKGHGRFIVAFHGGAAPKDFDDIRREHRLSLPIVQDSEHRVARKFGVRCWPTTIGIDADGFVEHIQLGILPDIGREPGRDDYVVA